MEVRSTSHIIRKLVRFCLCVAFIMLLGGADALAQKVMRLYSIRNGKMYIELGRQIKLSSLDSFITQYNLGDIGLTQFILTGSTDSLEKLGWTTVQLNKEKLIVSKSLKSLNSLTDPANKIMITQKHPTLAELFPAVNNGLLFGYNKFRNKYPFAVKDGTVTFFLRNNLRANRVMLAGSFNDWKPDELAMQRTDSGWIAFVKLSPGKYWYKFIADGRWMTDDDNLVRENDGMGNTNSVFFVTNRVFTLHGFSNARRVHLAGSFNDWRSGEIAIMPAEDGWQLPLYLAEGTHTYRFIVDGKWMADPGNSDRLPNEFHDYNSVIRIGRQHLFSFKGFENAKEVVLTGSFNNWRKDELYMEKTTDGWQLLYTIAPGNYEYHFIVDGKLVSQLGHSFASSKEPYLNSFMILGANYSFRLKGFPNAKTVYMAGDFNNWNPVSLDMNHDGDEWVTGVHLSTGKHLYKFIVDGKWIIDPNNPLWEQNEYGTGNSVIWFDH